MEQRCTTKVSEYFKGFKDELKTQIMSQDGSDAKRTQLLQFLYDYDSLEFTKEDFTKRKRVKNVVPRCDRCCAKRANDDQCTRKRREGSLYCGTHIKGLPHGTVENVSSSENATVNQVELTAQEIKGIIYYLDSNGNVYKAEDVLQNKVNPSVIAKYVRNGGEYSIPEFNI